MPIFVDCPDVHWRLVCDLLERARAFLQLKDCNSVRILFTCQLDEIQGQPEHALPSTRLVRLRISRVQASDSRSNPYCEFRVASADTFETAARVDFEFVQMTILNFFDAQFHANHWYHIRKLHAHMVMREPLGALAAMEGTSDLWGSTGHTLKFITDEKSLMKV